MLKYFETPYIHNGRSLSGSDCWGFVILYYQQELNVNLQDYKAPGKYADIRNSTIFLDNAGTEFHRVATLQKNDCILLKIDSQTPNHIAIYRGNGRIVHMINPAGVVVSRLSEWQSRVHGYYRYGEANAS